MSGCGPAFGDPLGGTTATVEAAAPFFLMKKYQKAKAPPMSKGQLGPPDGLETKSICPRLFLCLLFARALERLKALLARKDRIHVGVP
jgi:hypothetical protein